MSSYNELISDILDEIDEDEKTANISSESIQGYILQACQQIAQRIPVRDETDLKTVYGVSKYNFVDSTVPVTGTGTINTLNNTVTGVTATGTGTISTDDEDVTGVGTLFLTELAIGKMIIVGTEKKTVVSITSNTVCEIDDSFDTDLTASAFSYSTTMFTKEVNEGSVIISNSISKVVDTITDAYNMTVTLPYTVAQSAQTFTVDTKVTEIPTKFVQISTCNRMEGTVPCPVAVVSHKMLVREKNIDEGIQSYSDYNQPAMITEWQEGSTRYIEVYPEPTSDKQITLYGFIKINPRTYITNALTASIPLSEDYDSIIKEYVKHRIYKRLKDEKSATDSLVLFENYINVTIRNLSGDRKIIVDYT